MTKVFIFYAKLTVLTVQGKVGLRSKLGGVVNGHVNQFYLKRNKKLTKDKEAAT